MYNYDVYSFLEGSRISLSTRKNVYWFDDLVKFVNNHFQMSSLFLAIFCTIDVIYWISKASSKVGQRWLVMKNIKAGGFEPIRNREIEWR